MGGDRNVADATASSAPSAPFMAGSPVAASPPVAATGALADSEGWRRVVSTPAGPGFVAAMADLFASLDGDLQQLPHAARVQLTAAVHRQVQQLTSLRDRLVVETARGFERAPVPSLRDLSRLDERDRHALDGLDETAHRRLRRVVHASRPVSRRTSRPGGEGPDLAPESPDGMTALVRAQVAEDCATTEIALAAGVADAAVQRWARTARGLVAQRLPEAVALMEQGRLDRAKLEKLVTATEPLDDDAAMQVDGLVTHRGAAPAEHDPADPVAVARTVPTEVRAATAFERHVLAAVAAVDPVGADARRQDNRRARHVRIRPAGEGMAELTWFLPDHQAAQVAAVLDDAVQAEVAPPIAEADQGERRTIGELRSDALFDLITIAPTCECALEGSATTGTTTDAPTDAPRDGAGRRDRTASRRSGHQGGAPRARVQVVIHAKASTLFGDDPDPGWSPGIGPIAREVLRELAADADWRCAVTDDVHGTILGVGRSTYTPARTPTAALKRLLEHVAPTCCFPGCGIRAARCDLDHRVPAPGGPTCECNLRPLCRKHHWLKTHAGYRVHLSTGPGDAPGTLIWTTPTGQSHRTAPFTLDTGVARVRQQADPDADAPAEPEPPPPF